MGSKTEVLDEIQTDSADLVLGEPPHHLGMLQFLIDEFRFDTQMFRQSMRLEMIREITEKFILIIPADSRGGI